MRYVTSELWEMYELRHIRFESTTINIRKIKFDLKKLQTLSTVWTTPKLICSGFSERIPNIIKLGIYYEDSLNIEVDLSHLHKLEILLCQSELDKDGSRFLHKLRFPSNLRKLTLYGCVLESLNLVHWKADETNFPKLRELFVGRYYKLEEIPNAMGDIPTLQRIYIRECGASIVASAQQILKLQQEENSIILFAQTLSTVWITLELIGNGLYEGIPNIIKLEIYYEDSPNIEADLSHLHKLEILHCQSELDKDESLNLVRWKADETNFPKLRRLSVSDCYKLEEIPSAIGDIPTLQQIHIRECGASTVASVQQILKVQQEEYDNFDLKLYIR
ncbi:hypothetical protein SASPL_109482 [Salvia splendens]|uniref:Disease resistance protein RPM1 n=1 Tax=Salvia splendens TaxID=180675 RepID=A0A8X8YKQ8_SALSN|nr:hypothetical protein SASPL_109482 [Salvia splendens]